MIQYMKFVVKLLSNLVFCTLLLTGCEYYSSNQYVMYGTITSVKENIKYVEVSQDVQIKEYDPNQRYDKDKLLKNVSAVKTTKLKPVKEHIYTVRLRKGTIVTITQEERPILSVNQTVAVHYDTSGKGEVLPIRNEAENKKVVVPYGSGNMIIEYF